MSKESLNLKKQVVEEIKTKLQNAKSVAFIEYQGISVADDTKFRKNFREADVDYKVYKNRLIKIALDELKITGYDPKHLEGTTAVAFGKDEVAPATVLFKTMKEVKCLKAKFGLMDGNVIGSDTLEQLSKIPSKEVLIAQLMGLLKEPIAHLARTLDAVAQKA